MFMQDDPNKQNDPSQMRLGFLPTCRVKCSEFSFDATECLGAAPTECPYMKTLDWNLNGRWQWGYFCEHPNRLAILEPSEKVIQ
jgi:hypothetical protein